jgi:hypothetical protein
VVDTGSSNTWSISSGYTCLAGDSCHLGDPIQVDDNFELIQESTFYTSYVDGSSGTGALFNTSVQIAGITVPEQTIGLVKSVGEFEKISEGLPVYQWIDLSSMFWCPSLSAENTYMEGSPSLGRNHDEPGRCEMFVLWS